MSYAGPFIGRTLLMTGEPGSAVFFDTHAAMADNKAPGKMYAGSSGSGKSMAMFSTNIWDILLGKAVLLMEHKTDSFSIASLPEVQQATDNITAISVIESPNGSFDPFKIYGREDQVEKAISSVSDLMITTMGKTVFSEYRRVFNSCLENYLSVTTPKMRSMLGFVKSIEKTSHSGSLESHLGQEMRVLSKSEFARLFFADESAQLRPFADLSVPGFTAISTMGLSLPSSTTQESSYNQTQRNSLAVLGLILSRINGESLHNKKNKKFPISLSFDEAWAYLSTDIGKSASVELLRTARALNTSVSFASQSPSDFDGISSNISDRFIFKVEPEARPERNPNGPLEIHTAADMLGIPVEDAEGELPRMQTGECFYRDPRGNAAAMEFIIPQRWMDYIETNASKKIAMEYLD